MRGRKKRVWLISYACITLEKNLANEILDIHAIFVNFLFFVKGYFEK
jgi:hypothetical protein